MIKTILTICLLAASSFGQGQDEKLIQIEGRMMELKMQRAKLKAAPAKDFLERAALAIPEGRDVLAIMRKMMNEKREFLPTGPERNNPQLVRNILKMLFPAQLLEPPTSMNPKTCAKLLEQLGADSFFVRQTAQQTLSQAGPQDHPGVKVALLSSDPEVRMRMSEIVMGWNIRQTAEIRTQMREIVFGHDIPQASQQDIQFKDFTGGIKQLLGSIDTNHPGRAAIAQDMSIILPFVSPRQDKELRFQKMLVTEIMQGGDPAHTQDIISFCQSNRTAQSAVVYAVALRQASPTNRSTLLDQCMRAEYPNLLTTSLRAVKEADYTFEDRIRVLATTSNSFQNLALHTMVATFGDTELTESIYQNLEKAGAQKRVALLRLLLAGAIKAGEIPAKLELAANAGLKHEADEVRRACAAILMVDLTEARLARLIASYLVMPKALKGQLRQAILSQPDWVRQQVDAIAPAAREGEKAKKAIANLEKWMKQNARDNEE